MRISGAFPFCPSFPPPQGSPPILQMSLTLAPPPSLASPPRYPLAGAAPAASSASAAARTPRSRLRVSCVATCYAPPSSIAELEPRRRERLSLYDVLRVRENASAVEIKAAYRALAKAYHPDAAGGADGARDFIEIHNAYETLSDPAARAVYDLSLIGSSSVNSRRRSRAGRAGFYPTRRWETDQCW